MEGFELINFLNIPFELKIKTLAWRNHKDIAKYFILKNIDINTHINWLKSMQKMNPQNIAFIIKMNLEEVGVTYFSNVNYEFSEAEWGIFIQKKCWGNGAGSFALKESIKYAKNKLSLKRLYLKVHKENLVAINLYKKNGFKFLSYFDENFLKFEKIL